MIVGEGDIVDVNGSQGTISEITDFIYLYDISIYSLFLSTQWSVWKYKSLKLEGISFMKNYGITLIRGKKETSGRQKH